MSNAEKVVLVTGCDCGIGLATALKFAELGYRVSITGLGDDSLAESIGKLIQASASKDKANFLSTKADFLCDDQIDPVVSRTIDHFGRLDVLVNNAGIIGKNKLITESDFFEDFQNVLQVNLMACVKLAHLVVPHLKATKGVMISMSSIADRVPSPTVSYSVSKAGISMLTKAFANALLGTGVRAVAVAPGPVSTRITSDKFGCLTLLDRVAQKEEIADLIVFLASDKAAFIHGTTVDIDGGFQARYGGVYERMGQLYNEK